MYENTEDHTYGHLINCGLGVILLLHVSAKCKLNRKINLEIYVRRYITMSVKSICTKRVAIIMRSLSIKVDWTDPRAGRLFISVNIISSRYSEMRPRAQEQSGGGGGAGGNKGGNKNAKGIRARAGGERFEINRKPRAISFADTRHRKKVDLHFSCRLGMPIVFPIAHAN